MVTMEQIKKLREKTGAGIVACKKALAETNGDMEKAVEILRKEGVIKAQERASKASNEGLIATYNHFNGKIGVLVEVTSETDFVARTDEFKKFAESIAMHIAAYNPRYISREDVDKEVLEKERAIYREQALNEGKPEKIVDKIVEGRLEKFYSQVCLLEQPYIDDEKIAVKDALGELVSKLGENIQIKRFVRFELGEES